MKKRWLPMIAAMAWMLALSVTPVAASNDSPYFQAETVVRKDVMLEQVIINGPSHPPAGSPAREAAAIFEPDQAAGINLLNVPAYEWSFGCSATSAAMIAGYYDRTGFTNIYAGLTAGGMAPLDSTSWGYWTDAQGDQYAQCPLTASRSGLDGRVMRGSLDNYWVGYMSDAADPYITHNWPQHAWGEAIGDYMKTSQSAFDNVDGSTIFYTWSSPAPPFTCDDMENYGVTRDGTYGRKLFYETRGYTVTDCYNQKTDNQGGGFTYPFYKKEIDAGRPVMLNLAGHTVVGVGYDNASNTVYIHDTWDLNNHAFAWGGSYAGMNLLSVSIVNIIRPAPPAAPSVIPAAAGSDMVMTWTSTDDDIRHQVWRSANPHFTPDDAEALELPDICTDDGSKVTCTDAGAVGDPQANYTYVIRAIDLLGQTADAAPVGAFNYALTVGAG